MKKEEYLDEIKAFNNTPFGKRVKLCSLLPFVISIILAIFSIILIVIEDTVSLKTVICIIGFFIMVATYNIIIMLNNLIFQNYLNNKTKK